MENISVDPIVNFSRKEIKSIIDDMSSKIVNKDIVESANFRDENTFTIGEIVIINFMINEYIEACVLGEGVSRSSNTKIIYVYGGGPSRIGFLGIKPYLIGKLPKSQKLS